MPCPKEEEISQRWLLVGKRESTCGAPEDIYMSAKQIWLESEMAGTNKGRHHEQSEGKKNAKGGSCPVNTDTQNHRRIVACKTKTPCSM